VDDGEGELVSSKGKKAFGDSRPSSGTGPKVAASSRLDERVNIRRLAGVAVMSKKPQAAAPDGSAPPYKLRISRLTVDKLGVKLYDKASAVVAELIANGYDADADSVTVRIPLNTQLATTAGGVTTDKGLVIEVADDGHGMTPDEAVVWRPKTDMARGRC
jgi:hypothetical protein